eukprot:364792-Chlamydomonas_euryale.AAC.4
MSSACYQAYASVASHVVQRGTWHWQSAYIHRETQARQQHTHLVPAWQFVVPFVPAERTKHVPGNSRCEWTSKAWGHGCTAYAGSPMEDALLAERLVWPSNDVHALCMMHVHSTAPESRDHLTVEQLHTRCLVQLQRNRNRGFGRPMHAGNPLLPVVRGPGIRALVHPHSHCGCCIILTELNEQSQSARRAPPRPAWTWYVRSRAPAPPALASFIIGAAPGGRNT